MAQRSGLASEDGKRSPGASKSSRAVSSPQFASSQQQSPANIAGKGTRNDVERPASSKGDMAASAAASQAKQCPIDRASKGFQCLKAACDVPHPRSKRLMPDHPSAQDSMNDHFRTWADAKSGRESFSQRRDLSQSMPAGVSTTRLTEITRCDQVSNMEAGPKTTRHHLTDPITHSLAEEAILRSRETDGAAGMCSVRLVELNNDWAEVPRGRAKQFQPAARKTIETLGRGGAGEGSRKEENRRIYENAYTSNIYPLTHKDKYLTEKFSPEEIRRRGGFTKSREVKVGGGDSVNICGNLDMLPAGTQKVHKMDHHATTQKLFNDRKLLFSSIHGKKRMMRGLLQPNMETMDGFQDASTTAE